MDIKVKEWNSLNQEQREKFFSRSELDIEAIRPKVQSIIDQVKEHGDAILKDLALKFDGAQLDELEVSPEEWEQGIAKLDLEVKKALDYAIQNVKEFHKMQIPHAMEMKEVRPGILGGEKALPIPSVGLYVPRGRGSFPSMVYMMAVPASLAGVPTLVMVTPPGPNGEVDPGCLYAAKACGVQRIFKTGGAQAVAALTFGTQTIPKVNKIIGPGSMWVTAAKRLLYGKVDVGLPAGPTESLVIAEAGSDPKKVALDLMVEAEHGSDSSAVLLTPDRALAEEVLSWVLKLLDKLGETRKGFVMDVLGGYGGIYVVEDLAQALSISNEYAPEHLLIHSDEPFELMPHITNASEILLGSNIPFSAANYATGPNAILPTGGNAKTFGPVSVRDFMKFTSVVYVTPGGYKDFKDAVVSLAEYEGFETHANALKLRD